MRTSYRNFNPKIDLAHRSEKAPKAFLNFLMAKCECPVDTSDSDTSLCYPVRRTSRRGCVFLFKGVVTQSFYWNLKQLPRF